MKEWWENLLLNLRWADALDVLVIALLMYVVIHWLRRRASHAVAVALAFTLLLYLMAESFQLYLTLRIFQVGFVVIVISLVIIFQQDIRRVFEGIAAWSFVRKQTSAQKRDMLVDTLVESLYRLANENIGALVVIKGREVLDRHTRGGVAVDGIISLPLLHSIFYPRSAGHDGAILVERDRIEALGVHLPLSENLRKIGERGTRHTAALGLAERCDSLVLVVSEERGICSIAERGDLREVASSQEMKAAIHDFYDRCYPLEQSRGVQWIWQNPGWKALAAGMACLLWLAFANQIETVQQTFEDVPIVYRNLPQNWLIEDRDPARVSVTLTGTERAFNAFDKRNLTITIDLKEVRAGDQQIAITEDHMNLPRGLSVRSMDTQVVRLKALEMVTVNLPVELDWIGTWKDDIAPDQVVIDPPSVTVVIPRRNQQSVKSIPTASLIRNETADGQVLEPKLRLPYQAKFPNGTQPTIKVRLKFPPAAAKPPEASKMKPVGMLGIRPAWSNPGHFPGQ